MKLSVKMVFTRIFILVPLAVYTACPWDSVDNGEVNEYVKSWHSQAHDMQRDLQLDLPLKQSTLIHTHNAYNAEAYQNWTIRYQYPNQIYSMYDQLRMGSRALELDLHYTLGTRAKKDVLLCHGGQGDNDDIGCVIWDRPLGEGLAEFRDFVEETPNPGVIIINFESYLDDQSGVNRALEHIKDKLSDYVFRPIDTSKTNPRELTNREILESGRPILITDGKKHTNAEWDNWVWKGFYSSPPGIGSTAINEWRAKVNEGYNCDDYRSSYNSGFQRVNNDGTDYGPFYNGEEAVGLTKPEEFMQLMECNVNGVEADLIEVEHFKKSVWSWNVNEPDNYGGGQNCALLGSNNRWSDEDCAESHRVACKTGYGQWVISSTAGSHNQGEQICYNETGGAGVFAVPVNAYENRKLYETRNQADISDKIWLNYSDEEEEGSWKVNTIDVNALAGGPGGGTGLRYALSAENLLLSHGDAVNSWYDSESGLEFTADSSAPVYISNSIGGQPGVRFSGSGITSTAGLNLADADSTLSTFMVISDGSGTRIEINTLSASNGATLSFGSSNADIAEVLVYAYINAADQKNVECYLGSKYSITVSGCN